MAGGWVVLYNRIPELMVAVEANSRLAVAKDTNRLRDEAKARAAVDTGELRDSIVAEVNGKEGTVTVGAEHGIYNEYGTYKMPAHPFMGPAIEVVFPEFVRDLGGSVAF